MPTVLSLLVVLLASRAAIADEVEPIDALPQGVIAVGMAFDGEDEIGPATIEFLFEPFNEGILEPGDVVLEYRGHPVMNGAELLQLCLTLPDVAPGDVVPMVVAKADGGVVPVQPVAAVAPPKVTETTFLDRACDPASKGCLCSKTLRGSTCVRTITTTTDANGKIVSTSATCSDGVNFCPPPPPPPKKGK